MRPLALLLLLVPALPLAQPPAAGLGPSQAPLAGDLPPPPPPPPSEAPWPLFGLRLDAGVPDGAVAALIYRPIPSLRASVGPTWNYLGYGFQVGAAWSPFRWAVSPTLSLDYGHYFNADASFLAKGSGGAPSDIQPLLKKVGYDYLDGQLGLEFGSQRGLTFYLRGGLAYLWTTIHGATESISASGQAGTTRVVMADPRVRATIPTVKLGFMYFF
jgi:hypothetical protein